MQDVHGLHGHAALLHVLLLRVICCRLLTGLISCPLQPLCSFLGSCSLPFSCLYVSSRAF